MSGVECSPFTLFTLVWNFFNKFQYNSYHFTYETCRIHSFQFSHTLDSFAARRVLNEMKIPQKFVADQRQSELDWLELFHLRFQLYHRISSTPLSMVSRLDSIQYSFIFQLTTRNVMTSPSTKHKRPGTTNNENWINSWKKWDLSWDVFYVLHLAHERHERDETSGLRYFFFSPEHTKIKLGRLSSFFYFTFNLSSNINYFRMN